MENMIEKGDRTGEERTAAESQRARARLIRKALILVIALVLLAALCLVVASHLGFKHMACKMAEDTLDSALSHARTLARQVDDFVAERDWDAASAVRENARQLRDQLLALMRDDSTILYGMVLSKDGEILVHTNKDLEVITVKQRGKASSLSAAVEEFPRGHLGYQEFIYEVRTPLEIAGKEGPSLVLGLSRERIDRHIAEVRRQVLLKMLLSGGVGFGVLVVPGVGLWLVLRRYRRLAKKAREMALMAQMGQMANGLAHEIRNPLNAIRFNIKIMEEDAEHFPEEIRAGYEQIISRAVAEIDRLEDLLSEYLSYARPGRFEVGCHNLNLIVETVLEFVEYECRRYNINIQRNLAPVPPLMILADKRRLKQAVLNVVLNARQALRPGGGNIRASSYQRDGKIVLEIADDGPGVPEDERQKIFEPFYSNREEGSGLGLAIAKRAVEDYGGTIECRSNSGRGAVFVMTFPRPHSNPAWKERHKNVSDS